MKQVNFSFMKTVSYWNSEHGAGVDIDGNEKDNHWLIDVSHFDKTYSISEDTDIEGLLKRYLKSQYFPSDYLIILDDGRVSFNCLEDNDSNVINHDEKVDEQLYLCDYDVNIEIREVYEPSIDQLRKMFPNADY